MDNRHIVYRVLCYWRDYWAFDLEVSMQLFEHIIHPHKPRNVNALHQFELEASSFNQRLAVKLTRMVGSMDCAYAFSAIAFLGLLGLLGLLNPIFYVLMQWLSQQFLQLVLLSVIMVGQAVLGQKQALQADEQFATTQKSYHDIEQIMKHLEAQDEELLKQSNMLIELLKVKQ
jgi:uncharacterized membrane protein